ncbi:MAG TPA: FtsX-like permease family protein [Trebonia sp.]|nr:FtsX-like permease family protein [Trebonia sp.]
MPASATARWIRADWRAHTGQAALTAGIVAAVVAWLLLAAMLLEGANSPWAALHARTRGADVLLYLPPGTPVAGLSTLPGIEQASAPAPAIAATMDQGAIRSPVELRAEPDTEPAMSAPVVIAGSWLSSAQPDGVVVEASLAAATRLRPGSAIVIAGPGKATIAARVAGIAQTADQGPYPDWSPGLIWVTPALAGRADPGLGQSSEVVGLRLARRCATCVASAVDEVSSALGTPVQRSVSWQSVSQSMAASGWLLGELLLVFGVIALAAAGCAIANVTAARALAQRQSLAMLQVIGFTRGQVARALLAEGLLLALAGTAAGLLAARALAWVLPTVTRTPGGLPVTFAPLPGGVVAVIAGGTVGAVAIATGVQAWRAGRVSPVAVVAGAPPRGRPARLARVSLAARCPAPLVLGARDAFARRVPAGLTIAGVAIPMALITVALACWATIDGFTTDPGRISLSAALTAYPDGEGAAAAQAQVAGDHQVLAAYPGAQFEAELPGQAGTFTARAMGTVRDPYPFRVTRGRMFAAPGEAVASQRLLGQLRLGVGGYVAVTVGSSPMIFQVVGQVIDPTGDGDVLDFPMDALAATGPAAPQFLSLVLRPGQGPSAAADALRAASGGHLDVRPVASPADALGLVRAVIVISVVILAAIGLANLLTMTQVTLRDRLPDVGVLAAIGLTPAQVTATLVVSIAALAVIGVLAGTAAGLVAAYWLINAQGSAIGLGWGIEPPLSAPGLIAVMAAVAVAVGTATALLHVRRSVLARDGSVRVTPAAAMAGGPVLDRGGRPA